MWRTLFPLVSLNIYNLQHDTEKGSKIWALKSQDLKFKSKGCDNYYSLNLQAFSETRCLFAAWLTLTNRPRLAVLLPSPFPVRRSAFRHGAEKRRRSCGGGTEAQLHHSLLASPWVSPAAPALVIVQFKAGSGSTGDSSFQIVCSFHCQGFICQLATGAEKSWLHVGNGLSCPYFSSVHFEASVLLKTLMQTLLGGCVRPVRLQRPPQRTASQSWLHRTLTPPWLHFGSCVPNRGRGRAANVQGINPAARQAASSSHWFPLSAPCRIRPFLMNCQVIIVFPCLAFNVSWQKINELTGFQQVLWSKTRACQHRQNIKCVQQGSLACLLCVCAATVCV